MAYQSSKIFVIISTTEPKFDLTQQDIPFMKRRQKNNNDNSSLIHWIFTKEKLDLIRFLVFNII
jgi:hypothetical protein